MEEVTLLKSSPTLCFALSGEIDSKNADEFEAAVLSEYKNTPKDIVFDCEKLTFIDSTTLGAFVKILKHAKEGGHNLKLLKLQPRMKKLFVICALDAIMEIES